MDQSMGDASVVIAQTTIDAQTETNLFGEFILSGPGAGTLQHSVEILEIEN